MTETERVNPQREAATRSLRQDVVTLLEAISTLDAGYDQFTTEQRRTVLDIAQRHVTRLRDGLDAIRQTSET